MRLFSFKVDLHIVPTFPSPYGEEVSATCFGAGLMTEEDMFPSPYGEEVSATGGAPKHQPFALGFRPLTGKR